LLLALFTVPALTTLQCSPQAIVGTATPWRSEESLAAPIDEDRLDLLSRFAKSFRPKGDRWREIGASLRDQADRAVGPLSAMDLYWIGSAWWAANQPARHLRHPDWAPRTRRNPDLALLHPEGGNCESSANAHAALLTAMGVPSRPVYGRHVPDREGHVWVVSDVDGRPYFSDVHVARTRTVWERSPVTPWYPSEEHVQVRAGAGAVLTFLRDHLPEREADQGIVPPLPVAKDDVWVARVMALLPAQAEP